MDKKVASKYTYEISPGFLHCRVDTRKPPFVVDSYIYSLPTISLGSMTLVNKGVYECNSSPLPPPPQ
jgi:hypothetical protein